MAKKRKRSQPSRRKRFNREKRLQSAEGWIKNYEGKKLIKAYRKRYGVDWESAFKELAMLGVPIDPKYKESVLRSAANQLAAKRRKKLEKQAKLFDSTGIESNDYFAFIVGYTSGGAAFGLTWEEWEFLEATEFDQE